MDDVRGRLRRASTASSSAAVARARRTLSAASATSSGRESSRASVRASEFDAFLSDSSDEDEEDADARALARMQQQADDRAYLPDRADSLLFRLDSPNGGEQAPGFLPDQLDEGDEDATAGAGDSFADDSFAGRAGEQDASFAGSDLRPSGEDGSRVGAGEYRSRASDERSEDSGEDGDEDEDGDYIEENDDSFVAVHRPVLDDYAEDEGDDSDEEDRQRRGMRDTSAFEVAATNVIVTEELGQVQEQDRGGDDVCVTVTIDEAPSVPRIDDTPRQIFHGQEEHAHGAFEVTATGERDSSFSNTASPAQDSFLSANDSFVAAQRASSESADKSFLEANPRPTFGSAGSGSFGDPFLGVNDSFVGSYRGSNDSADKSFLEDNPRPTFGSVGAGSFSDPFLSVNDSFTGVRRGSADSTDKSFLDDKPWPTRGSAGAGSFSEDIDASFRLDGYGDSFGSVHNDSYVAAHAPHATDAAVLSAGDDMSLSGSSNPSERIPDVAVPSAGDNPSSSSSKSDDGEILKQLPDSSKSSFVSAARRLEDMNDGIAPTEATPSDVDPVALPAVIKISVSRPDSMSNPVVPTTVVQRAMRADTQGSGPSSDEDGSDLGADMEQTRFSRVPSSMPRDSSRPIDFRDTQHRYDEEEVQMHHAGQTSSLSHHDEAVEEDVPGYRENSFSNSQNSLASSFAKRDGNFFVGSDRGSDASYSRSISDSFASMVIMGDTPLDGNSLVGGARPSDVSMSDEKSDKLDHSYSNLIDTQKVKPLRDPPVALEQQPRSSGAGSVLSQSSASVSSAATEEELSFVSFNGGCPPAAASPAVLSSSKVSASGSSNQSQTSSPSFFLRSSNATVIHADSFINGKHSTSRVSEFGDPSIVSAGSFVDASFTSSIDDSEIYPDVRTRGDTRSDEVEAGDVVQGVLPSVPPPLKIGIPTASPATSTPLGLSSSFGSIGGSDIVRNTDDALDFTGVYRGSVNSLESSRVAAGKATAPPTTATTVTKQSEDDKPLPVTAPIRLARSVSDSVQRESQRKVEDFFRRTYKYQNGDDDIDDDIRRTTRNRETRARTTVIYCVDENEEESGRNRSGTIATTKVIDLKNIKGGHKFYQKVLTPQRESEDLGPYADRKTPADARARRGSRFYTNDLTDAGAIEPAVVEMPADTSYYANLGKDTNGMKPLEAPAGPVATSTMYASATDFGLSPKASEAQAKPSGFFAASRSTVKRLGGFGAFGGNRRADNVSLTSLTPSQPRISMDSASHAPSPFTVAMLGKSPGMSKWQQENPNARDLGLSPGSSVSVKESLFRPTGLSRPTFSEQVASHVQQFSSSLTNTIRRAGAALFGQSMVKRQNHNDPTSPQSTCPAPPRLARGFDERGFYSRFARCGGVEDPHDPPAKVVGPLSNRQRKRRSARLLRMAAAALVGVGLGVILTQVGGLGDTFGVKAAQVHEEQMFNGERVLPVATQWIVLPGRLFLRVWNCVTIPLLFCHAANGVADVVMGEKGSLLLGFRTFGVMLLISVIATLEGIGAMAITNNAGWFQASDTVKVSTMAAALGLKQALGTSVYADGAVGLLCSSNHEYLQMLGSDQFNCSNASIALPIYDGASGNGTMQGSGAAIFALNEVTRALSTMESNASAMAARYYPEGFSASDALEGLLESVVPNNSIMSFVQSSPVGVVMFAIIVGLFCGQRAFHRLLAAKAAMDSSTRSYNTRTAMAAEHNARQPHFLLGILVELQLALEWILVQLETYIAPIGVLSLLMGNMVAHYQEWQVVVTPMVQLIVGVLVLSLVHTIVVVPLFMKLFFKTNVFKTLLVHFTPAFLFAFCSGSVALSTPVTVRCFSDARIVTKSTSQAMATLTGVLHRSGNALYFSLALLWLMETNSLSANASLLDLDGSSYALMSVPILCSCFAAMSPSSLVASGISSRGNLTVMMTLWRVVVSYYSSSVSAAMAVPPTFPLLVVCDVVLSRVVDVVNVYGSLMVTLIVADHCDEVVVDASSVSNSIISPIQL